MKCLSKPAIHNRSYCHLWVSSHGVL